MSEWKIFKNGELILDCESSDEEMISVMKCFIDQQILAIKKFRIDFFRFQFTGELDLLLKADVDFYEDEDDLFILFTPIAIFTYNSKFGFVIKDP